MLHQALALKVMWLDIRQQKEICQQKENICGGSIWWQTWMLEDLQSLCGTESVLAKVRVPSMTVPAIHDIADSKFAVKYVGRSPNYYQKFSSLFHLERALVSHFFTCDEDVILLPSAGWRNRDIRSTPLGCINLNCLKYGAAYVKKIT